MDMITVLEQTLGRDAVKRMRPMQPGDVTATFADIRRLNALCGYNPKVTLEEGLPRFIEWYQTFTRDSAERRSQL
jgi:UDP-glucuronate 4-epimerase